jgi:hypothetical protein
MIKSAVFLFLIAASAHAFVPVPRVTRFGRHAISVASSRPVMFMASPATEEKIESPIEAVNGESTGVSMEKEEELSETQKLMKQVKESGTAGVMSYALWELAFWFFSVPVCIFGYREVTG